MQKYEQTDDFTWIRPENHDIFTIINGVGLPDGRMDFEKHTIDLNSISPEKKTNLQNDFNQFFSDIKEEKARKEQMALMLAEPSWTDHEPDRTWLVNEVDAEKLENLDSDRILEIALKNLE